MAVLLSPVGGVAAQFFDNAGNVLTGGKIETYAAGTTTPQATYTSSAGVTFHSNPIILDASGRVPGGEIWLTDGLQYKFVLKDANDILIGTYDNIVGINSNFVNFTNQQEIQTATAGQTVFTLTTTNYSPGTNSLSVFVDGVNQYGPGAQYAYLETNSTTVTFVSGLHVGASVKFTTSQNNSSGVGDASQVSYLPAGANAVVTTVQTKLRESVSAKDFGAVGNGVTDDTVALKNAFDYAIPLAIPVELEGSYLISGPIQPYLSIASGSLHIVCKGNVTIIVNPAAAGFSDVLYLESTAINNASIVGGSLSIDGSNKAGRGITIRHNGGQGGNVVISARLRIVNILETDAVATRENQALSVFGRYETVVIDQPFVQNVNRTNPAGATKGIAVSALAGVCTINQPYAENVLCVSSAGVDADGIAVFGYQAGGATSARQGTAIINEPTIINCQGRSFKGQISDVAIYRPRVKRTGSVVAIANGSDFEFQISGDVMLHEPVYEYYENGGISPFSVAGSSFSSVVFQQTLDDREMSSRSIGGTVYTQVQWPRYCAVIPSATAKRSVAEVSGLKIIPVGAFASSALSRTIMEIGMGTVASKTEKTKLIVKNVEGPFSSVSGIGYTGYTSGALNTKFSWQVTDCHSTLSGAVGLAFGTLSGTQVGEVDTFLVRGNYRFSDLLQTNSQVFSFAKLVPSCKFTVDLATLVSVTNPPAWGSTGYATIECLQQWALGNVVSKVFVGNATTTNSVFYTQSNGTTWGTIK